MKEHSGESRFRFLFWRTDFVGIAMIVSGLFFLLVNFNLIPASDFVLSRVLGILFIMIGLIFLFFTGAGKWLTWFMIPAGAFLTVGIVTFVVGLNSLISLDSGSMHAMGLGLTFLALFYFRRGHWWVLIPAGLFIGVALWVAMGSHFPVFGWHPVAPVLFLGLSFLVIWVYSVQKRRMRWSLLVGAIIVTIAFFYLLGILLSKWSILWPVVLLLVGLLLPLWIAFADRRRRDEE
jgi:hypothetical protein